VLSAIEGLKVERAVAGTRCGARHHRHSGRSVCNAKNRAPESSGRIFGPVMLAWFAVSRAAWHPRHCAGAGRAGGAQPVLCVSISSSTRISTSVFAILGAAFLAVTGGEAMYADMGAFRPGCRSGSRGFAIALPALVLNYFGTGGGADHRSQRDRSSPSINSRRTGRIIRWWRFPQLRP